MVVIETSEVDAKTCILAQQWAAFSPTSTKTLKKSSNEVLRLFEVLLVLFPLVTVCWNPQQLGNAQGAIICWKKTH